MVYKKYIQKNGKLYGPYIYHSKRVGGKVISEYYGTKEKNFNYKTFLFIFAGIVLLAALIFFFIFSTHRITGNVVLGLDASYEEGKPLDGVLKFSLKEGELIPESSKIVFENSGKTYEFVLSDIFDEEVSEGNYYVYGKEIQGNGLGYGIEGENVIYPEVEFILQVYSESNAGGETIPEEASQVFPEVSETIPEEVVSEEESSSKVNQEVVSSESIENPVESNTDSIDILPDPSSNTPTTSTTTDSINTPATEPNTDSTNTPTTGNSVKNSRGIFASFFGLTGMVSMELENEISEVTSKGNSFIYELKEGETAELKPKSVKIGDESVEDKIISLKIEDSKVIVTTDYSEIEKGYGEDYAGSNEKIISLDLPDLNLLLEKGDLTIRLVYGEEELIYLKTFLKEGEKTSNEAVVNVEEDEEPSKIPIEVIEEANKSNKTFVEENKTVEEIINSSIWDIGDFLTTEERKILADKFGGISLQSTKSELFKGRIIRGYKFDKYYIEYSYDAASTKELLEVQMESDRIKFLKDIANSVSKEETIPTSYIF